MALTGPHGVTRILTDTKDAIYINEKPNENQDAGQHGPHIKNS